MSWRRVRATLIASTLWGALLSLAAIIPAWIVLSRAWFVGFCAMLAFGVAERWPKRLPPWLARWPVQLIAIVVVIPFAAYIAYWITTGGNPELMTDRLRLIGYALLTFSGILFAPWIALAAMVRQRDAFAAEQALAFQLARSELERQALDARMRLLQAQVEPHFLFNTLANVQTLVDSGSPRASAVLGSLIAYLRAAVPRLHERTTTLGQEVTLVRAYLEVMHMRIPDRLQFAIHVDDAASTLVCPPMTLMTLAENAVRHGIDPSEEGGRIDIDVRVVADRCLIVVTDTGVGLRESAAGLGTGLAALRERLQLIFGDDSTLKLAEQIPRGMRAEVTFPTRREAP